MTYSEVQLGTGTLEAEENSLGNDCRQQYSD